MMSNKRLDRKQAHLASSEKAYRYCLHSEQSLSKTNVPKTVAIIIGVPM